jgi:hypothetical protein
MHRTLASLVVATALLHGAIARAQPPDADVPSSDDRHAVGEALWVSGLVVLASTWALTGASATVLVRIANARDVTIAESWIPLVGPWIMLGDSAGLDTTQVALTAVSAALQTLATAALIVGLVLDLDRPRGAGVTVAPSASAGGAGLAIAGSF